MNTTATLSQEDIIFNKNKWLFAAGGIGRDMVYCIVSSFLLTYIQFGKQLSLAQFTTISIAIGVLGRIWDGINDPLMGAIIEGSHLKWGKYKPWIFFGALFCGIATLGLFNIRPDGWNFVIFIIVMYLIWESVFTVNDIGYWAMLPSLSSKKEQRNSLTMMTVFCAGIGGFLMQGMVSLLSPGNILDAYTLFSVIAVVAMILCQSMTAFGVQEKKRNPEDDNSKISLKMMWTTIKNNDQLLWMCFASIFYNIGSTLLASLAYNLYYIEVGYDGNIFIFLVIFGVGNLGIQTVYPKLAKKLGRKKLQTITAISTTIGYIGIFAIGWTKILPFNLFTLSFFGIFIFVGQALFYISMMVNMLNCVEYNEYKQGKRSEAVVSTMRPFIVKLGDAIRYGIVTLVLACSGVFMLSQNISNLETQVNYFNKTNAENVAVVQTNYINTMRTYINQLEAIPSDSAEYKTKVNAIQKELDNNKELYSYRINAEYILALKDLHVYRDGNHLGTIKDADLSLGSGNMTLEMIGSYTDKNGQKINFNIGNNHFLDKATIKMRMIMRIAASLLPAILIIVTWLIQRKKFIIDEEYYDMMIKEIASRKQ